MNLELEILQYSYWEHFKYEKDLSLTLPLKHPKRVKLLNEINEMLEKIHQLKNKEE